MTNNKMLQILIDGQVKIREEIKDLKKEIRGVGKRVDVLGASLAYLEDDSPTNEDFNKLEKRVIKNERKIASL